MNTKQKNSSRSEVSFECLNSNHTLRISGFKLVFIQCPLIINNRDIIKVNLFYDKPSCRLVRNLYNSCTTINHNITRIQLIGLSCDNDGKVISTTDGLRVIDCSFNSDTEMFDVKLYKTIDGHYLEYVADCMPVNSSTLSLPNGNKVLGIGIDLSTYPDNIWQLMFIPIQGKVNSLDEFDLLLENFFEPLNYIMISGFIEYKRYDKWKLTMKRKNGSLSVSDMLASANAKWKTFDEDLNFITL